MHIAFILDGNRRWAKELGKPAVFGHQAGFENFIKIVRHVADEYPQIKTVSAYALSTENLKRSKFELKNLFKIFISLTERYGDELLENGVKVKIVGNLQLLPNNVHASLKNLEDKTAGNTKLLLQICVAYGGQDEIVRAAQKLVETCNDITEENFALALDSSEGGPIDLVIRTGGKQRLSNFMLWQAAYAELHFTKTMWPAFDEAELQEALSFLIGEQRNFGE